MKLLEKIESLSSMYDEMELYITSWEVEDDNGCEYFCGTLKDLKDIIIHNSDTTNWLLYDVVNFIEFDDDNFISIELYDDLSKLYESLYGIFLVERSC